MALTQLSHLRELEPGHMHLSIDICRFGIICEIANYAELNHFDHDDIVSHATA